MTVCGRTSSTKAAALAAIGCVQSIGRKRRSIRPGKIVSSRSSSAAWSIASISPWQSPAKRILRPSNPIRKLVLSPGAFSRVLIG
jgi:hypothetical protein